ncbi:alpha-E domain-containing protein [Aquimarina sp. SS2-1]|uniref:alpha-E domain-containing protein n=1 Tax=Aquimarina besae TaxID=3342247 RepID=UPI00366FF988
MLARVANNLFWMGRYIERSEHVARYLNVNYFSSLDAPNEFSQSRDFVMRSMKFMVGDPIYDNSVQLEEKDVLYDIALNFEKTYSIVNSIKNARENANGARDLISTELYEAINKLYHFVLKYPVESYKNNGLYDFTVNVAESTAVLRGKIRGTLYHDEVYAIIMLGINLERATQIIRIINSKHNDTLIAKAEYGDMTDNSYEWTTLLKCTECYDMMRRYYRKTPTAINTLEFLILNRFCPRSVMNCLNQVSNHISILNTSRYPDKDSTAFLIGKIRSEYEYKLIDEINGDLSEFIENILNNLVRISQKVEKEYFNY